MYRKNFIEEMIETLEEKHAERKRNREVFFCTDQVLAAAEYLTRNNKLGLNETRDFAGWIRLIVSYIQKGAKNGSLSVGTAGFSVSFDDASDNKVFAEVTVTPNIGKAGKLGYTYVSLEDDV